MEYLCTLIAVKTYKAKSEIEDEEAKQELTPAIGFEYVQPEQCCEEEEEENRLGFQPKKRGK